MTARKDGNKRADFGTSRKYTSKEERDIIRKKQKNEATNRWRLRNKEKVDIQRREYRKTNSATCIARTMKWYVKNKDRAKDSVYRRKYGLTLEKYNEMFLERGGKCDICGKQNKLVVDHCHKSNEVRGLLCDRCNVAIGCLEDDLKRIRSAADYIERNLTKKGVKKK